MAALPLFVNKTVDEDFPFARDAVVLAGMTPGEVEQIMAGMAKVNQEVDEAMPADMMVSPGTGISGAADTSATQPATIALKEGNFQDADRFHQGSGQAVIYRAPTAPICSGWNTLRLPMARTYTSFLRLTQIRRVARLILQVMSTWVPSRAILVTRTTLFPIT